MFIPLAIIFLVMILIVTYSLSEKNQVSLRQYIILMRIILFMVLICLFFFEPKSFIRWDLLEHYNEIELLRYNDLQYALDYGKYRNLPITNLYFFLISRMDENNFLMVLPFFIDSCAFIYILKNSFQKNKFVNFSNITFAAMLWWCTFGFKLAVSGIRCVTAVAIVSVAIYKDVVQKKRNIWVLLLYVVPLMIHQFTIVLIAIRLFALVKRKKIWILAIPVVIMFASPFAKMLGTLTSNYYLQTSINLLTKYWDSFNIVNWLSRADTASITIYSSFIVIIIYIYYMMFYIKEKINSIDIDAETLSLLEALKIVAVGSLFNYLIIERLMYFIAYGLVICFSNYIQLRKRKAVVDYLILAVCLWLCFFNDIYIFLVNYTGYYFLTW